VTLIRASGLNINFGFGPLLDGVGLGLEAGEQVCLVGRNGQGKTTLMKILAGILEPDDGDVFIEGDAGVAYLQQAVPDDIRGPLLDVVLGGAGGSAELLEEYNTLSSSLSDPPLDSELERMQTVQEALDRLDGWNIHSEAEAALAKLSLEPSDRFEELSGGRKRQCLLIRALVSRPQVLILDEPTNHLDIQAIGWLEDLVRGFQGAVLFVTHDRAFLRATATRILDLDRGKLTSWPGDLEVYKERKAAALDAEAKAWSEFDKHLAREEVWIRQGIKARRTRNEGRVRALKQLREQRTERRSRIGAATITLHDAKRSGARVITAENIHFAWPDLPIVEDFTLELQRGDRLGVIGPNGCGKTTLLRLLLGSLEPQSGTVDLGTKIEPLYFDQLRGQLDESRTVQENLCDDSDTVIVGGNSRHIISYLNDFLFSPDRARSPVKLLSGGERNRLLLAKLFVQEANLLVLDEPTNDLDAETLELLESTLLSYKGTLIVVSHDREFLNNVVTSCVAFDADGQARHYGGGYDDWLMQRPALEVSMEPTREPTKQESKTPKKKMTFNQKHQLAELPGQIEVLETEQTALNERMMDPSFFGGGTSDAVKQMTARLSQLTDQLAERYERWEALETLRESLKS
jgi:ATP-binding cassette subfamily F protein uup